MRVTVLGAGTAIPAQGYSPAGIYVRVAGEHVLLDAGAGSLQRLQRLGAPWSRLDRIFLTQDQWPGYGAERQDFLDFVTDEGVKNVIFMSTDFHIAVVNDAVTPDVRELVAGAIAMNRFFDALAGAAPDLLPTIVGAAPDVLPTIATLPVLFPTFSYYDLNRFTVVLATVTADDVTFQFRDNSDQVLREFGIPAVP